MTTRETTTHPAPTSIGRRSAWWALTFLGFPLGGLPALALGGVVDARTALVGGAAAGAVIGTLQVVALRRSAPRVPLTWVAATTAGLALGLTAGSSVVGYATDLPSLLVQGLASGVGVGVGQGLVLARPLGTAAGAAWAAGATVLWPLGWAVTWAAGVSVEDHFAVFGATGALAYTAGSGLVLLALLRRPRSSS